MMMTTSVLCLALLMVTSVVTARPPPFDDTSIQQDDTTPLASVRPCRPSGGGDGASGEDREDALSDAFHQVAQGLLRVQEALRLQEQEAERRAQEALHLQEQRAAAALREAVRQMEKERDEVIRALRGEFSNRMQRMEERMNLVEGQLISSPTTARYTAVGVQVHELEKRVIKLEVSDKRAIEQVIPSVEVLIALLERYSPEGAPSDIPPASTGPFSLTYTPTVTSTSCSTDNPFTTHPTSFFSFTSSTSTFSPTESLSTSPRPPTVSAPGATESGGTEADSKQEGDAAEEQRAKERLRVRIKQVEAKRDRARAAPSSLGEDLCNASFHGRLEDVRRLLDSGADLNYTNSDGHTPFILAVRNYIEDDNVVYLLLENGADVNAIDMSGWSPLHYATYFHRSRYIVSLLIAEGADVDARDVNGTTPLHHAAHRNNLSAVRELLGAGARKNLKGWSGIWLNKTPFDVAIGYVIRKRLRP